MVVATMVKGWVEPFARMNHLIILCLRVLKYILCASITICTALSALCSIYGVIANLLMKEKLMHLTRPFYKLQNAQIKFV